MLAEDKKIVPLLASANYGAGVDMDSFKAFGDSVTVVMTFGSVTGNAVLKVYSGATAGTKSSLLPFKYAYGSGAIAASSADVLSAWGDAAASSGLTLTAATYGSKMAVIHFNTAGMDTANKEEFITINVSNAASSGIMHAVAIIEKPRYTNNVSKTVLA